MKMKYHPLRKKILLVGIPLYLLLIVLLGVLVLLDVVLLGAKDAPGILSITAMVIFLIGSICLLLLSYRVEKIEIKTEQERFAFLFTKEEPPAIDALTVELDVGTCILTREGMTIKYAEQGEQVFDEVNESEEFIPWDKTDIFLATKVEERHVFIAVAVFRATPLVTVFHPESEENQPIMPTEMELDGRPSSFFLTLTEELYDAIRAFGLEERLSGEFLYLFYNPDDAFKQIFKKGRIVVMRNKKTGKLFVDEQGNFIGDD